MKSSLTTLVPRLGLSQAMFFEGTHLALASPLGRGYQNRQAGV